MLRMSEGRGLIGRGGGRGGRAAADGHVSKSPRGYSMGTTALMFGTFARSVAARDARP
jgi:hypothetical protein